MKRKNSSDDSGMLKTFKRSRPEKMMKRMRANRSASETRLLDLDSSEERFAFSTAKLNHEVLEILSLEVNANTTLQSVQSGDVPIEQLEVQRVVRFMDSMGYIVYREVEDEALHRRLPSPPPPPPTEEPASQQVSAEVVEEDASQSDPEREDSISHGPSLPNDSADLYGRGDFNPAETVTSEEPTEISAQSNNVEMIDVRVDLPRERFPPELDSTASPGSGQDRLYQAIASRAAGPIVGKFGPSCDDSNNTSGLLDDSKSPSSVFVSSVVVNLAKKLSDLPDEDNDNESPPADEIPPVKNSEASSHQETNPQFERSPSKRFKKFVHQRQKTSTPAEKKVRHEDCMTPTKPGSRKKTTNERKPFRN